jgi:hypothetical protein
LPSSPGDCCGLLFRNHSLYHILPPVWAQTSSRASTIVSGYLALPKYQREIFYRQAGCTVLHSEPATTQTRVNTVPGTLQSRQTPPTSWQSCLLINSSTSPGISSSLLDLVAPVILKGTHSGVQKIRDPRCSGNKWGQEGTHSVGDENGDMRCSPRKRDTGRGGMQTVKEVELYWSDYVEKSRRKTLTSTLARSASHSLAQRSTVSLER